SNGRVVTDFNATGEYARGVAIQPDGKIIAAGYTTSIGTSAFAAARYNSDGTLDTATFNPTGAFGGSPNDPGMVTTDIGTSDSGYGLAIQNDGKIVVGGSSASDFGVVRYMPDGDLDSSFDTDGKVTTDF
ncbi:MAG: hypothetical protein GTO14_07775, partial [Anaerolineales bacterium]|nr:hypothetical protein [Anaerolineales bacterium]